MIGALRWRNSHCFQGQTVGVHRLIGNLKKQRVLRRRGVQIFQRKPTGAVGKLVLAPPSLHHEPLARLHGGRLCGNDCKRLRPRTDPVDACLQVPALDSADEMHVIFDQARNDRSALQIDDLGVRADVLGDLGVAAHRDDSATVDSHGFGNGEFIVYRQDLAVVQHSPNVGPFLGRAPGKRRNRADSQRPKTDKNPAIGIHVYSHIFI